MIRGIILLILSSVALTLAADYTEELCHFCEESPRPVYEEAFDYFPTPSTRDMEYVRPNDCHDLEEFYEKVSVPHHGFIRDTSTSLLSGLILEVVEILEGVVRLVEELLGRLLGFRHESGIINHILDDVLDGLLRVFPGCHHPLHAATYVEKLHHISCRRRQLVHDDQYLEKSYGAAQTRHELINAQKNICDKYMTVSRNLDTRQRRCNGRSGSGGLLSGLPLVGGILNPSCDRASLLETILGIVQTVVDLISQILSALGIDIENLIIAINIHIHDLTQLNLIPDFWERVSDHDRFEDEFRNGHIHPIIKHLENHHCVPQHEIYRRYADIMAHEDTRNHYYHLSQLPVRGYRFDNCHMTCRNSKGIDISLDIEILGLLSLDIDIDLDIFCELSFQIEIDVDVNLGHNHPTIHDGVHSYLESMRVVTQGITGCNRVHPSVVDIDVNTGLVHARLDLLLRHGQRFCNPLIELDIDIDIGSILGGVPGHSRRHITECNSYHDVESLTYAIQDADNKIYEHTPQGPEYNEEIETLIYNTDDLATYQETHEAEYQDQYWNDSDYENEEDYNDEDVIKQAYDTVQVYTDRTNRTHEEFRCALEHYRRAIDITEARIHTCRKEYLEARLRLLQNPTDTALIEICAAAEARFTNYLQECIFLREYFTQIYADINLHIGVLDGQLLGICIDLQARISLMESGLINLCEDIRIHLSVHLNLVNFNEQLFCLLRGLRPTIRAVECLLDDVLGIGLGMHCRIDDECHEGESYEHMRHVHHQLLRPAVAACAQNPYVRVDDGPVKKRSDTQNECNYRITFSDEPKPRTTVDRATEETGMTATTAATSSASSLVFSFLILFLSVLCFF
jgi:hypothetical protein